MCAFVDAQHGRGAIDPPAAQELVPTHKERELWRRRRRIALGFETVVLPDIWHDPKPATSGGGVSRDFENWEKKNGNQNCLCARTEERDEALRVDFLSAYRHAHTYLRSYTVNL